MIPQEFFQTPWNQVTGWRGGSCYGKRAGDNAAHFDENAFRKEVDQVIAHLKKQAHPKTATR